MFFQLLLTWTILQTTASQCLYNYNSTVNSLLYSCENVTNDLDYVYYMDKLNPQVQKDIGSVTSLNITINFINSLFTKLDNWIASPMTNEYSFWSNSAIFFNFSNCGINSIEPNTFDFETSSYLYPALDLSYNNIKNVDFLVNTPKLQYLYLKNATDSSSMFKKVLLSCTTDLKFIDLSYTNIVTINWGEYNCFPEIDLSYSSIKQIAGPAIYSAQLKMNLTKCEHLQSIDMTFSMGITFTNLDLSNINNFSINILKYTKILNFLNLTNTNVSTLNLNDLNLNGVIGTRGALILDLSNANLQSISKQYFMDFALDDLNLSGNNLSTLEQELFSGAMIKQIDLSNSQISEIKVDCFLNLKSEKLVLSKNKITSIKSPFTNATVTELSLSYNNISSLTNVFKNNSIVAIDLSFNPIQSIDSNTFSNCLNLTTLNLTNTYIPNIADYTFKSLSTLQILEISIFGTFEPETFQSMYLKSLTISNSDISILQDGNFKGLYNLQELKFTNSVIGNVSNDALKYLVKVEFLDVKSLLRDMKIIPKELFKDLLSLTSLDISYLQLEGFEAGAFDRLISLESLNATGSSLENDFRVISKLV